MAYPSADEGIQTPDHFKGKQRNVTIAKSGRFLYVWNNYEQVVNFCANQFSLKKLNCCMIMQFAHCLSCLHFMLFSAGVGHHFSSTNQTLLNKSFLLTSTLQHTVVTFCFIPNFCNLVFSFEHDLSMRAGDSTESLSVYEEVRFSNISHLQGSF